MKLFASLNEVPFHKIEKIVVLLWVDPRIFDDQQPIGLKRFRNLLAILLPTLASLQKSGHINCRNLKAGVLVSNAID